ncbi:MAG: hypothetical protein ACYCW6_00385 [Candidatus Xenobia bacterium]
MKRLRLIVLGLLLGLAAAPCYADKNEFFDTYPYFTAVKGEVEVELWNDFFTNNTVRSLEEEHFGHQISVEYGVTDRWMVEVYGIWQNNPTNQGVQFQGERFETRYRLNDYNPKGLNAAIYFDLNKSSLAGVNDELENRIILERDFGETTVVGNAIFEHDLVPGSATTFAYALAINRPVSPTVEVSLEGLFKPIQGANFIVPSVSFPVGKKSWMSVGVSYQTDPKPSNLEVKTMYSHEFR